MRKYGKTLQIQVSMNDLIIYEASSECVSR